LSTPRPGDPSGQRRVLETTWDTLPPVVKKTLGQATMAPSMDLTTGDNRGDHYVMGEKRETFMVRELISIHPLTHWEDAIETDILDRFFSVSFKDNVNSLCLPFSLCKDTWVLFRRNVVSSEMGRVLVGGNVFDLKDFSMCIHADFKGGEEICSYKRVGDSGRPNGFETRRNRYHTETVYRPDEDDDSEIRGEEEERYQEPNDGWD